jgi:hypothetical protein
MRYLITIFSLFFTQYVIAQQAFSPLLDDFKNNYSIVDSLHKDSNQEIIILKTDLVEIPGLVKDSTLCFIIWPKNEEWYFIKMLSKSHSYPTTEVRIPEFQISSDEQKVIFSKNGDNTFKFVPPITTNNSMFFLSPDIQGYFEQPDKESTEPVTYCPTDPEKEKLRKAVFDRLVLQLKSLKFTQEPCNKN